VFGFNEPDLNMLDIVKNNISKAMFEYNNKNFEKEVSEEDKQFVQSNIQQLDKIEEEEDDYKSVLNESVYDQEFRPSNTSARDMTSTTVNDSDSSNRDREDREESDEMEDC